MKQKSAPAKALFFSLAILFILACNVVTGSGTSAPAPTNIPVATHPSVATDAPSNSTEPPVAAPTEAPVQTAEQYFTENFDSVPSNWTKQIELNGDPAADTSQAHVDAKDGYMVFDLGKWLIAYMFYDGAEYDNVRIDARVDNRGTNVNDVLLVCRVSEEGHYLINIANSGLFSIYAYDGVKKSYSRISNGGSTKIKPGKEVNDYALVCKDRTIVVYINGTEARRYTDNDFVFRNGKVGIGVASEDHLPVKVEFDWVKVSQP